ncbi:NAD(P)-dependent oxidoreductase [bacterium]|nr:NAD(P)-dependent oxidoreductase [bacterium]
MRVAVTGGSGLLGRRIVKRLARDHDVVNIDIRAPRDGSIAYVECNILDSDGIKCAIEGYDVVVHVAGLPGPDFGTPNELMSVNAQGSREIAAACISGGVKRVVFISSEAVLGFVFSDDAVRPRYFPVDEGHSLIPTEPYGESKLLAETFLEQVVAPLIPLLILRPPWIWVPEEYGSCRELLTNPARWSDGLWAYVHGDDVAEAVARGLTSDLAVGSHVAFMSAPDNGTVYPTRELVRRFFPEVGVPDNVTEFGSLLSSDMLETLIGFRPLRSWREFLTT